MIETPAFRTAPTHPVRWLVAVVAFVAVALLALWWAGLVNPRVEAEATAWGDGAVMIDVVNQGPLAVRVVGAEGAWGGVGSPSLLLEEPVRVPPGGSVELTVTASVDDCIRSSEPIARLDIRTAVGVERTVDVRHPHLGACSG